MEEKKVSKTKKKKSGEKRFFEENEVLTQQKPPEEQPKQDKPSSEKKSKKAKTVSADSVQRFHATAREGLTDAQVEERIAQGLYNKTAKKYSKTYKSIFVGNICTFFNLLCLLAAVALIVARAPFSQFTFVLIFVCNIVFSIFQEIRAKIKIDKLTILSSPTALVIRNGKKTEIP